MVSFFVNFARLLVAIRYGVKKDAEFRVLLFLMLSLLAGGTVFYWRVEGWGIIDSLYFSVMTMSTIGYGDFAPTTAFSKLFTIMFAILSIGVFVAVVAKIVAITLERKKQSSSNKRKIARDESADDK